MGKLTLLGGLGLRIINGSFTIGAHFSVGSKTAPIFLQIGFLGGGVWLESMATKEGGANPVYSASVGLAVGSTRAMTLAGIAQASYSLLMFASAEFQNSGGTLRAGLSMEGAARILGFCNAYVGLLLEVIHESTGHAHGHGVLDLEIEICWCFTLRINKSVEKDF